MPRIRYLKPEFFTDEKIGKLQPLSRLFFLGMWCYADKNGILEYKEIELGFKIMPYDLQKVKPATLIKELEKGGFIYAYESSGNGYLQILNFKKHQRPHPAEKDSGFPYPKTEEIKLNLIKLQEIKLNAYKGMEKGMETEKGMEMEKGTEAKGPLASFVLPDWIDFDTWNAFLEIRKKKKAAKTDHALNLIIKELEKFKAKGHNPKIVLEKSIMSGWPGVYEPKEDFKNQNKIQNHPDNGSRPITGQYDGLGRKC